MRKCRDMSGILAASLYEPPSPEEQRALDEHLAGCARCRKEAEALRAVVDIAAPREVVFQGDLLPILRERLAEEARFGRRMWAWVPRLVTPLAAAVLVTFVAYRALPTGQTHTPPPLEVVASPMEKELVAARNLAKSDFMAARTTLLNALGVYPEDPRAGDAQLALAELELNHGQRYEDAYQAFSTLRANYPETWNAHPECADRFDLLDEARAEQYEPLYAYDAARNSSGNTFAQLEKVVARYPEKLVAALAVNTMAEVAAPGLQTGETTQAAALEAVRGQCTDPVALAAVNVSLGNLFMNEMADPGSARECFVAAAQSPHPETVKRARAALASLDAMDATRP